MSDQFHALTVRSVRKETPDAVSLALDVPAALEPQFRFEPGQYLTVRTTLDGEEVRRSYSVCSAPGEGELRIAVKRHPSGRFSTFANERLKAGDRIEVMGPRGRFTVPEAGGTRRVIFAVAAGSGITPVISILKTLLAREPASEATLIYGNRHSRSIIFKTALEDLKDRHLGRFTLLHALTQEHQDAPLLNGRIDAAKIAAVLKTLPGGKPDLALLCGPMDLLKTARAALEQAGMTREQIRVEVFDPQGGSGARPRPPAPAVDAGAPPAASASITLHGRQVKVPIATGESVLEAATRAGLDAPYSCKGGMCSTCRARLTAGTVAMSVNYALEPWEIEAGFVLTCQSHPTSSEIAVDYDAR